MADYSYQDLIESYESLGLGSGRTVYITGNFGRLGRYDKLGKSVVLQDHLYAIQELIGDKGTLVVPTHTWTLCNTDLVYDPLSAKSETGPFTEFVRQQAGSVRMFHPFSSLTALGYKASDICSNNSRHVFGMGSPFQRMIDMDALYVSVGQHMERSISLVHHIELVMGVPYRYVIEFVQQCLIDGTVEIYEFYVDVLRYECDIVRDRNKKIMANYRNTNSVVRTKMGRSFAESLSMPDFYHSTAELFAKDIYVWLKDTPIERPYRK